MRISNAIDDEDYVSAPKKLKTTITVTKKEIIHGMQYSLFQQLIH